MSRARALAASLLAALVLLACGGPSKPVVPAAERRTIQAYAQAVKDLSFEGGRVLQQEVKPRVSELRDGAVTPAQFGKEAENWIRVYQDFRRRLGEVERVERLDGVATRYDNAFATYVEAFRAFLAASRLSTEEARNQAITDAVPIAERADERFDLARDALRKVMRVAGLDPAFL